MSERITVALGDVAIVPLSVPDGANATVRVGSDGGYSAAVTVDDDGDGNVTLLFNTYLAGNRSQVHSRTFRARGADEVTAAEAESDSALATGSYPVRVRRAGSVVDERTVTVTDPSIESVTARRAVPQLFTAADVSEIRAANRSGLVRPLQPGEYRGTVVQYETLVLRIDAASLRGAIAAHSGNTATERFAALVSETEWGDPLNVGFSGPCGGVIFPDSAAEGAARALLDDRNGTVYVLLDSDDVTGILAGEFGVRLAPDSRLNPGGDERALEAAFGRNVSASRFGATDQTMLSLPAEENATVRGTTGLLPDSRVVVALESRSDPIVERRRPVTVGENGTVEATFDLSDASARQTYEVSITDREVPAEAVPAKTPTPTPTATPEPTETAATPTATTASPTGTPTGTVTATPDAASPSPTAGAETSSDPGSDGTETSGADGAGFGLFAAFAGLVAWALAGLRHR